MKITQPASFLLNLFLVALLGVSGVTAWHLHFKPYVQKDTVNIHAFPSVIGAWTAEELTITEEEYSILETHNAFARRYTKPTAEQVDLFIVYSQNNRKVSHPPEICYTGGGATILSKKMVPIPAQSLPHLFANKVVLEQARIKQIMLYWFKVGNEFTANYWNQQMLIAMKTLKGQPASSALIRISAVTKGDSTEQVDQAMVQFIDEIGPLVLKFLP